MKTTGRNESVETALQYLTWALEEIEKVGNQEVARYVRVALNALRDGTRLGDNC
jgi:hypothetical protein